MSSKNPRARHRRFLAAGFFPPELPPCFYSEQFGKYRNVLLGKFNAIPATKNGIPDFHLFRSQRASFNFPRFNNNDRRHSFINPISFFFLSKVLSDNYVALRKIGKASKLSLSPSIFDWSGERALKRPIFDSRDTYLAQMGARFEFLLYTDIRAFYHSIYTHAVPWAIHTKPVAKKNHSTTLVGNLIDLLCRNSQDGQTVGLPVGPDTSRMIAEIVGAAIDKEIQKIQKKVDGSAMRFVDDFCFGCNSIAVAEKIAATVRRSVNEYELDVNNEKTTIQPTNATHPGGWKTYIRSMIPPRPYKEESIDVFLYRVDKLARENTHINIEKFAIQNARRVFVECDQWKRIEQYLISTYRRNSTVVSNLVEIFILRGQSKNDVSLSSVQEFVESRIPVLYEQQRTGEVVWLLYLAISLGVKIKASCMEGYFQEDNSLIALQIADARKKGLVNGAVDFSRWNKSLTSDGLKSEMWLYAYEGTLKTLTNSNKRSHVSGNPYFKHLLERKIEFYRSGEGIFGISSILRKLKKENVDNAKLLSDFEDELSFDIDEIEDGEFESDDDAY